MSVQIAYASIILIWSTTPLAIAWSNETLSPEVAVGLRMVIAAVLGYGILKALGIPVSWDRKARKTYRYSLMGVFGAMMCTYQAANYIPSGLISVLFALAPVCSNLFSTLLLGKAEFNLERWFAFLLSFIGLAVICLDEWVVHEQGWIGVALLLLAVCLYSLGGVLVQREQYHAHPLSITVGTLISASPLFLLAWFFLDGQIPQLDWQSHSPWAVVYLSVFGSLIGFAAYFFIVRTLGATAVAMVTLITPVLALILGTTLNNEHVSLQMILGTGCVLAGLLIYYRAGSGISVTRAAAENGG